VINGLTTNYGVLEDLVKIYGIKKNDYMLRDMKLGKSVSLIDPFLQEERACKVVKAWFERSFEPKIRDYL